MSDIEWTDRVWNPVVGCSRVSAGCQNCYAERFAHRGLTERHKGLTVMGPKGPRWTGEVRLVPEVLAAPLRWREPRKVFVNSMSDLFHEDVPFDYIAAVFGVMAASPKHTFQVLTKRPERAKEFFDSDPSLMEIAGLADAAIPGITGHHARRLYRHFDVEMGDTDLAWPLPNVWLGVSVEDQATADSRIPLLLECPAAVRWVSYEPALGPVDFKNIESSWNEMMLPLAGKTWSVGPTTKLVRSHAKLDWIVVGGESGPGARPFNLAWARSVVKQCAEADVPCFVKQLGARSFDSENHYVNPHGDIRGKGGDMAEWPEDLRVRQWPEDGA